MAVWLLAAAGELKTQLRVGAAVDLAELWNLGGRSVSHASLSPARWDSFSRGKR